MTMSETDRLAKVEARLQLLEDREEIRALRMRYHRCVNERIFKEAADIHTEDALVDFAGQAVARGREEIAKLYDYLNSNVGIIRQFPANHVIEVNGDEATGNAIVDARYSQDGKSIIAAAGYDEKYRRTPQGWKISEMIVSIYFSVPVQQGWAGEDIQQIRV
jgi:ketosteroid isomerase-like protein